jgi:hypothetical protein
MTNKEKISNYFYYHKVHIIVSVLIILVATFIIYKSVTIVPPDIKVVFVGQFSEMDENNFTQKILKDIPQFKRVETNVLFFDANAQDDLNVYQATSLQLANQPLDIIIMDQDAYDRYGKYVPAENLVALNPEVKKEKTIVQDGITRAFYISGNRYLQLTQGDNRPKLVLVSKIGQNKTRAQKVIESILKNK